MKVSSRFNPLGYLGFLGALGCLGFVRYLPGGEPFAKLHALFGLAVLFLLFMAPKRRRGQRPNPVR